MSKVSLYEPAMCCDTGVCGPGVDTELLRVSSIIQTLEKADGVEVERFNLTGNPAAFVENEKIGELLQSKGADILPVVLLDGEIVKMAGYPSNEEFDLSELEKQKVKEKISLRQYIGKIEEEKKQFMAFIRKSVSRGTTVDFGDLEKRDTPELKYEWEIEKKK